MSRRSHHRFVLAAAVALSALPLSSCGLFSKAEPADPKLLVETIWLDRLPEKQTDAFDLWVFFDDGFGYYQRGSSFRGQFDVSDFARDGDKLTVTFLQDQEKVTTRFTIERCSEAPPMDLCLTFDKAPKGPRKLYGFSPDHEGERRGLLASLKKKAVSARVR